MRPRKTLTRACILLQMFILSAAADQSPADLASGVRQAVLGIISYTRWPRQVATQRLCVVGQPGYAGALFGKPMQTGGTPVLVTRNALATDQIGEDCDTVYAGALSGPEAAALHRQIAGHPLLTITESDPSCSGTFMFCLDTSGAGGKVFFAVNLDSVARSGVLVNPRVLLLGRRKKTPP